MRISDWSSDVCSSDLPQRQRALPVHGIPGIEGHVDQRRFKLAHVSADVTWLVAQLYPDLNPRARDGLQHVAEALHLLAHIDDLRLQRLTPGEGEQLADRKSTRLNSSH